ncbi:MAG TPA: response regulator [Azospirillaceae bacterium]|nr:response regulator [Azospirillaceae bacterium]
MTIEDTGAPCILLVEDNEDDADLIKRAFRKAGLGNPVVHVSDGQQALDFLAGNGPADLRARCHVPAVILLDLKLPLRTGFDVLEWRRVNPPVSRIPVVVLTSSNQDSDITRAYDLGANSYLVKPVGAADLMEMVRTLQLYWVVLNRPPAG